MHDRLEASSRPGVVSKDALDAAVDRARNCLLRQFRPASERGEPEGGFWVGELEADTTLESDYILFLHFLDPEAHREKIRKLANYIVRKQLPDGSWNIYHGGPGDVSASVKAYFALKLAGYRTDDSVLSRAKEAILRMGGAECVNSYTKIYLSFLDQFDWQEIPALPPEIVLLPRFFYFNVYEISCWSRAILIPLSILYAKRPIRSLSSDLSISEIFLDGPRRRNGNGSSPAGGGRMLRRNGDGRWKLRVNGTRPAGGNGTGGPNGNGDSKGPSTKNLFSWENFFLLADRVLKVIEKMPVKPLRGLALKKAEEWIVSRIEDSDGLGAIFPSMINSVMAMHVLGYDQNHPHVAGTIEKLSQLEIEEGDTLRLQPCLSPVWDTALAANALGEAGAGPGGEGRKQLLQAARWLLSKEVRKPGDWKIRAPNVDVSGWYFQFRNEFYPDIDDTAAVLMALERVDPFEVEGLEKAVARGINWTVSMQCSNGGWAAFDVDVNREALTKVPYADHNAMLDPACADITGRILEMLARFPSLRRDPRVAAAMEKGIQFLKDTQEEDGSWYGRWGVNSIYGTWQALKGLCMAGEDPRQEYIQRAVYFLKNHQNDDGGWGESCESYRDPSRKARGPSTASQTAWAVMGLIAASEVDSEAVTRGIQYLLDTQGDDGNWEEEQWTGTGFPCVFYLKYHLYRLYFPLFALAYYRNVKSGVPPARERPDIRLRPSEEERKAARSLLGLRGQVG